MLLRFLPLALFLLLCGCASTLPPHAPEEIPKPPVVATGQCETPDDLPDLATANELTDFAVGWMKAYGCERAKKRMLLEAWPR